MRLGLPEIGDLFLALHEILGFLHRPSTLGLIKNGDVLIGRRGVDQEVVARALIAFLKTL